MLSTANHELPRRVSFDLSHNTVYLLPTLEECRDAAKQRSREEWQKRSLNEEMLSEEIIIEIQEDCSASSRDSEEESEAPSHPVPTKSCLKKPPVVVTAPPKKKHTSSSKKNQKKRKRSNSKVQQVDTQSMISVH